MGGRYITVHVYPYDFKEFLYANGVEVTENSLFATESRAEIKRIFNDYFRSGGFPEGASLAAKRDYLTSVYQKIYLGDMLQDIPSKILLLYASFPQIGRKYKATGFVYSYN